MIFSNLKGSGFDDVIVLAAGRSLILLALIHLDLVLTIALPPFFEVLLHFLFLSICTSQLFTNQHFHVKQIVQSYFHYHNGPSPQSM